MTLEDAIKFLKQYQGYEPMFLDGEKLKHAFDLTDETVDTLLAALRGPTREMVERMRGEWEPFGGKYISRKKCSRCGWDGQEHIKFYSWCPACGTPMTDEAVDMMLEKLEAMYETAE